MHASLNDFLLLAGLGCLVGAYGTLIGAGGGFLLVPVLLLMFPEQSPASVTAMSLAVVFFNAYGGTWAYARTKRIDYRAGVLFAIAGIPGALLGTALVKLVPRGAFDVAFGVMLLAIGFYLLARPIRETLAKAGGSEQQPLEFWGRTSLVGSIGSAYVGLFATLMGIGGGILHVPFLVRVLRFPPHRATATSQFVLLIVAFTGVVSHLLSGELDELLVPTAYLALGVMMGAPVGAAFSTRLSGTVLIRLLAVAIALVAARLLSRALY